MLVYVISPYSPQYKEDGNIKQERYDAVCRWMKEIQPRSNISHYFSPILHWHPIAAQYNLPTDAAFWKAWNTSVLRHAHSVVVLRLPGWKTSVGVQEEISLTKKLGILITYVDPISE